MEKITVDKDLCIGCGMCVHTHPEYITFDENVQADPIDIEIKPEDKLNLLDTIEKCPTEAIRIEEK